MLAAPRTLENDTDPSDLRLFLEDICCDLCRFQEAARPGVDPEQVRIDREVKVGPEAFADIRVAVAREVPYFVEVKYGYTPTQVVRTLLRKYAGFRPDQVSRLVLVLDSAHQVDWARCESELRGALQVPLEVWPEDHLLRQIQDRFGVRIDSVSAANLVDLRAEIDRAKGFFAFGGTSLAEYSHDPLRSSLIWHFGFWRLRQLREEQGLTDREMLVPGRYEKVVVLLADLCAFSSFVRDTADTQVVRQMLTDFYTKARYQIVNRGGMLSQFVGDEVVAYFGLPDQHPGFVQDALETARALLDIGAAVAHEWQRRIDHVQHAGGVHIGMAMGDLEVFPQRSFSRTHMGQVGDAINLAARLMATAGPGEIAMSNLLYRHMSDTLDTPWEEQEPVEAKNIGRIKSWKYRT